jgi:hypothetical protein
MLKKQLCLRAMHKVDRTQLNIVLQLLAEVPTTHWSTTTRRRHTHYRGISLMATSCVRFAVHIRLALMEVELALPTTLLLN